MITDSEILIRMILDEVRPDIRPLACTLNVVGEKLFDEGLDWSELCVTKDIYPVVAHRLGKQTASVARSAERLANRCWEAMDQEQIVRYIGKPLRRINAPSELIFYLAFYLRRGEPYYRIVHERLQLLLLAERRKSSKLY